MLKKNNRTSFESIVSGSSFILESINDAVLLMEDLNFIDCNQKAVELFGFKDKAELIGLTPYAVSPKFQAKGLLSKKESKKFFYAALKGKPQFFDWIHTRQKGILIDTEVSLKSIKNKGKKYVVALVRDISEKKKTEKITKALFNIAKATNISDSLVDLLSIIQKEVNTLMEARNFYVALVVDEQKSLFRIPFIVDINDEEIESVEKILDLKGGFTDHVLQTGKPLLANRSNIQKLFENKSIRLIGTDTQSWMGVPLRSRTNEIIGVIVIQSYSDPDAYSEIDMEVLIAISPTISSSIVQKDVEQKVKNSEDKFKQLFNNIPDAVFITTFGGTDSGRIIEANAAAEIQTGYSIDELIGMNIGKDLQAEQYDEALVTEREVEIEDKQFSRFREKKKRKDGLIYWTEVMVTKTQLNNEIIAIGVNRNITAQVQMEQALRESEEKFRAVIEEAVEIVFTTDDRGHLTYVNPAAVRSTGYSEDELMKKNYIDLVGPEYLYKVKSNYFRQYLKKELQSSDELPFVTKSGEKRWYQVNVRLILEKDEVNGFYIIARDVTEKRKAEAALEESEEKFRNFIENSGIGFAVDDVEGNITYFNNTFADIFGYTPAEMKNQSQDSLVQKDDLKVVKKYHQMRITGQDSPVQYEVRGIKKDGSEINLEVTVDKVLMKGGFISGTQMFFKDITGRKRTESEILSLKENLEAQVEKKTEELREKISDLQRFHDATIEREFRIKELNDEIDELTSQLKKK